MTITRQTALLTTRGGLAVGAAVLLAACGSSSASNGTGGSQGGYGGQGGFGSGQSLGPGASGLIEAVSGTTAQVLNTQLNEQVAVSWTSSTKFTQEVAASKAAVTVGSCVTVRAPQASSSTTSSASPTVRPTSITAASVRISASANGTCAQGGGRFGGQGVGAPSGAPSGFGTRTGQPGQGRSFRSLGAFGKVTTVTANGFTVQSDFGGQTSTTTVTTTGSTTYMTTANATSAAVKQGACLQATGSADSTGAVTATRIALSQPVGGACTSGFGPRG